MKPSIDTAPSDEAVEATTLREVEAWLYERLEGPRQAGSCVTVNLDEFAAHFNPEAE